MKGFDTKALLLFPYFENYDSHGAPYKYKFKTCVQKMVRYLHSQGYEVHAFVTDDVAMLYKDCIDKWVSPLSKADRFFASKNCDGMTEVMKMDMVEFPDIYAKCARKDAGTPDMSVTARYDLVVKHNKQACAAIIPQYNVVVHFMVKSKLQYKATSKPGDKRIRINIDAGTFIPTVLMSGSEMFAADVLNVPYGNRSLENWEV